MIYMYICIYISIYLYVYICIYVQIYRNTEVGFLSQHPTQNPVAPCLG